MSPTFAPRLSRRELLACGFAGTLAGFAAAGAAAGAAPAVSDGQLLSYALEIERLSAFAYEHALGLPALPGASRAFLAQFLSHEQRHAAVLESELRAVGEAPPARVDSVARANGLLKQHGLSTDLGSVRTVEDAVKLLLDIEGLNQGAYYAMAGLLSSHSPLLAAVQALACEAQHQTLLTGLLYPGKVERAVPGPFVEGWK